MTVRRYPTKFPLTQSMSSTGATADGFDRQFGIGRAGDAPCQLIGNVEALCQSIDPGRVFIGKSLRGRGSPRRFAEQVQCLHLPDVRPAYRLDWPWACYMEGTRAGNGSVQVPGVSEQVSGVLCLPDQEKRMQPSKDALPGGSRAAL